MKAETDRREIERILALFEIDERSEVKDYCHDLVVSCDALFQIILAGRYAGLHPYVYDCHFSDYDPDRLSPEDRDLAALAANGIVPLHRRAVKASRKVAQSHELADVFAAHLLYTPSRRYWHLFCFDPDDDMREPTSCVRYSRANLASEPLTDIWREVCSSSCAPRSLEIHCARPTEDARLEVPLATAQPA